MRHPVRIRNSCSFNWAEINAHCNKQSHASWDITAVQMEFHSSGLAQSCRICGGRLAKARKACCKYSCRDHCRGLQQVYGVDVSSDVPDVHPKHFCKACHSTMTQAAKVREEGMSRSAIAERVVTWTPHATPGECQVRIKSQQITYE